MLVKSFVVINAIRFETSELQIEHNSSSDDDEREQTYLPFLYIQQLTNTKW